MAPVHLHFVGPALDSSSLGQLTLQRQRKCAYRMGSDMRRNGSVSNLCHSMQTCNLRRTWPTDWRRVSLPTGEPREKNEEKLTMRVGKGITVRPRARHGFMKGNNNTILPIDRRTTRLKSEQYRCSDSATSTIVSNSLFVRRPEKQNLQLFGCAPRQLDSQTTLLLLLLWSVADRRFTTVNIAPVNWSTEHRNTHSIKEWLLIGLPSTNGVRKHEWAFVYKRAANQRRKPFQRTVLMNFL